MPIQSAQGQTYEEVVVNVFVGGARDGAGPAARLISDSTGYFYGTTYAGGVSNVGTVFRAKQPGSERLLYSFSSSDGANPAADLIIDKAENLYGTTYNGGTLDLGTVFMLGADGHQTVLHHFAGGSAGSNPAAGLALSPTRELYGTTVYGGNLTACNQKGCGIVFKVDAAGSYFVLHRFIASPTDGGLPLGDLVRDSAGNLYGTTSIGGTANFGTVFMLRGHSETILYSFQGGTDGAYSKAGLLRDKAGNLYGTTEQGGGTACTPTYQGCGTVFKIDTSGHETVLHAFKGGVDGKLPLSQLVQDSQGNLYGTTEFGGTGCGRNLGCGTVFKLDKNSRKTLVYRFTGHESDGRFPASGLAIDSAGSLYGTTGAGGGGGGRMCHGGQGCGTMFSLTRQ